MATIDPVTTPTGKAAELLDVVKKKLGMVPNMMAALANSPAALEAYLNFSGALGQSSLSPALREKIALVVSEINGCDYCLAAHTKFASMYKVSDEDIAASRKGSAQDPKEHAALTFSAKLVKSNGNVSSKDVDALRAAGFDNGGIADIVAVVSLNVFTNYFNHTANTEIDFPRVR
jgi:uncharacterized peroxidase-related enzyme